MSDRNKPAMGRYDHLATRARCDADADCVVLVVLRGKHGTGFTLQERQRTGRLVYTPALPALLRDLADQIERGVPPDGSYTEPEPN
jgi:hypothetical protein